MSLSDGRSYVGRIGPAAARPSLRRLLALDQKDAGLSSRHQRKRRRGRVLLNREMCSRSDSTSGIMVSRAGSGCMRLWRVRLDLLQPTPPMDRHVVGAALRPGWVGLLAAGDPRRWSRSVCSSQPRKTMNSPHPCKKTSDSRETRIGGLRRRFQPKTVSLAYGRDTIDTSPELAIIRVRGPDRSRFRPAPFPRSCARPGARRGRN